MLTPEQVKEIRKKYNITPIDQYGENTKSSGSLSGEALRKKLYPEPEEPEEKKGFFERAIERGKYFDDEGRARATPNSGTAGKGLEKSVKGLGQGLGEIGGTVMRGIEKGADAITGTKGKESFVPKEYIKGSEENIARNEELEAVGGNEKLGKFLGDIMPFILGEGVTLNLEKLIATQGSKALPKVIAVLEKTGIKNASEVAEKMVEIGARSSSQALEGAGIVAAQTGGNIKDITKAGLASAVFPVGSAGSNIIKKSAQEGTQKIAPKLINSVIKPLLKDFSYGKNPGRTIAKEGIIGNSFEELAENISKRRSEIGEEISDAYRSSEASKIKFNMLDVLSPLDEAIKKANKSPRTNSGLINRLQDLKDDLMGVTMNEKGIGVSTRKLDDLTAEEAFELKKDIGDLTKFTGNASDDSTINKALKDIYGNIKDKVNKKLGKNKTASGKTLEELNEAYADLTSAEVATKYRDKIESRQNLISVSSAVSGIGPLLATAITTGGVGVPALLAGATGVALEKAIKTPRVMTRVARWLAKAPPEEKEKLFTAIPALRGAVTRILIGDPSKNND